MLEGRDIALYSEDAHELAVLEPIGAELERRGARVRVVEDFSERAEVGVYACHSNRFFDFSAGVWRRPRNRTSILALHDLGQNGSLDADYFASESWHVFDLGLLPGAEWTGRWERAQAAGIRGPVQGMRAIGWPKMDHVHADPERFSRAVAALRERLGIGAKPALLLACSWSDRRQLEDALEHVDLEAFDLVVKYPVSSPAPAGSPWEDRLNAAFAELGRARGAALEEPRVTVADDETDIMELLAAVDAVLSNGSNVLYEGVLAGVPGVSIRDWVHPAGPDGNATTQPQFQFPGVLSGDLGSLPTLLRIVRSAEWEALVHQSAAALVEPSTRGRAAALAADAIAEAVRHNDGLSDFELDALARDLEYAEAERDTVRRLEEQLSVLRQTLEDANERELRARDQLEVYEVHLAHLKAQLG